MPTLALALAVCAYAHVSLMALAARLAGVAVREISYGYGPALLSFGQVRIKLLPFGGFVRMKDTRAEDVPAAEAGDAFDTQSLPVRLGIALSGCAVLLSLALQTLGIDGWDAFTAAFVQFFTGALSPAGEAQSLLSRGLAFAAAEPFVSVCALVAAKFAAVNLLPFPAMNGGQAVAMLSERLGIRSERTRGLVGPLLTVQLLLSGSWLFAVGYLWLRPA